MLPDLGVDGKRAPVNYPVRPARFSRPTPFRACADKLLDQALRLHRLFHRRSRGDAARVALKRRPLAHVELE